MRARVKVTRINSYGLIRTDGICSEIMEAQKRFSYEKRHSIKIAH